MESEEKKEEKKEESKVKQIQANLKRFISLNKIEKLKALEPLFKDLKYIYEMKYYYLVDSINLPNLVELYIESSLDEDESYKFIYSDIFKDLKNYCFIPREYIISIYQYFSDIFSRKEKVIEKDKKFLKFPKVVNLWAIFYNKTFQPNIKSPIIVFSGDQPFYFSQKKEQWNIVVYFNSPIIHELNENLVLLELQFNDKNVLTYSYNEYFEEYKKDIEFMIIIEFRNNIIQIQFDESVHKKKNFLYDARKIEIETIKILDKFYGEISLIQSFGTNLREYIYPDNVADKLAVKYINYHDRKNFNIYNYFNGLKPFVPFPLLIRGLSENDNIQKIGGIDKKEFLKNFVQKIFDVLVLFCDEYNDKTNILESDEISEKKIANFIIPLFFEIDFELLPEIDHKNEKILSLFFSKYNLHYLKKIMVQFYKERRKSQFLQEIKNVKFEEEEKELLKGFDYKRLYEHYMKELFIYNGYWSKREYFFKEKAKNEENGGDERINENKINVNNNDDDNDSKLKYKQLSYYTRNYQQPILYPILQYDKYIPDIEIKRTGVKADDPQSSNIYKHSIDKIVKYNFSLSDKMKGIFNPKEEKYGNIIDNEEKARCCLVKKMYHVKGIFSLKKYNDAKKKNQFDFIFISDATQDSDKEGSFCHPEIKKEDKKKKEGEDRIQCFGSILPCCKKEYNKEYIFESKNIMFLILRNYYTKTSAIEIFTYDPYKSYYFNFKDEFESKKKK